MKTYQFVQNTRGGYFVHPKKIQAKSKKQAYQLFADYLGERVDNIKMMPGFSNVGRFRIELMEELSDRFDVASKLGKLDDDTLKRLSDETGIDWNRKPDED